MKALIVDDDAALATTIERSLAVFAHTADIASNGADGAFMAKSYDYDAIILDYSLPKKDGLDVCREVRQAGRTAPILFLSNTSDVDVKVQALQAGADDYMTKPFSLDELRARLDALLRRAPQIRTEAMKVADLELDPVGMKVSRGGKDVHLTRKEFMLVQYFMKNRGAVLSRPQIMEHVWSADGNPFSNTVEAHVRNVRLKLNAGGAPDMIANLPGRGYVIVLA
jgi:two-component system OmpR family response regulator